MGDELALGNDYTYERDAALSDDNRWMHRPGMDWEAAERRTQAGRVESSVFQNSAAWLKRGDASRPYTQPAP